MSDAAAAGAGDGLLIRNAHAILTGLPGDAMRWNVAAAGGDIRIAGGRIQALGRLAPEPGERQIDATDCIVQPGWVNTHHHLFQSLLKGVPAGIGLALEPWLTAVPLAYRRHFDNDRITRLAARVGLVELALSGCTTVADHQYHHYPGMPFDPSEAVFDEAEALGLRMVMCRGGQTQARAVDSAPSPQTAPETLTQFLDGVARDVRRFHDPGPLSMRRVVCAPTTPTWSVPPEELAPIAREARRLGIRLHSHLSETGTYVRYCRDVHCCSPVEFCGRHEWLGPDVWFAHMVHLDADEIALLTQTGTGVAHCPQSNCRLGSGIAPLPALLAAGVAVGLGVDGAASNEAADMGAEAHTAWMVHRALGGAGAVSAEDVLRVGTVGGARVLGFDAVGTIAPGQAADIAVHALDQPRHFGLHDTALASVVSGGAPSLRAVLVNGRVVVDRSAIPGLDLDRLRREARDAVRSMATAPAGG